MNSLYVSGKTLQCEEIVKLMKKSGIAGWVQPNDTIQCKNGVCWFEQGCKVLFEDADGIEKNWDLFQSVLPIQCGYVHTHSFKGCVLDYLRPSSCVGFNEQCNSFPFLDYY